jgi:hypothetical protein
MADPLPETTTTAATPCEHPQCGSQTACCRPDCPIVMVEQGDGRWRWMMRAEAGEWHVTVMDAVSGLDAVSGDNQHGCGIHPDCRCAGRPARSRW